MFIISQNFKAASLHLSFSNFNPKLSILNFTQSLNFSKSLQIKCAKRTKRTGKLRYPSEKKKLKQQQNNEIDVKNKFEGVWRLFKLRISAHEDPGKDFCGVSEPLLREISKVLEFPVYKIGTLYILVEI